MEVYLDNSATTRCYDSVGKLVAKVIYLLLYSIFYKIKNSLFSKV